MAAEKVLTLPTVEFELWERGAIAGMLFKPIQDDKAQVRFLRILARLCHKQETRQPQTFKRKRAGLIACEPYGSSFSKKRKNGTAGVERSPLNQDCEMAKEKLDAPRRENVLEVRSRQLFPIVALC